MFHRGPLRTYQGKKNANTSIGVYQRVVPLSVPLFSSDKVKSTRSEKSKSAQNGKQEGGDTSMDYDPFDTTFDRVAKGARLPTPPPDVLNASSSICISSDESILVRSEKSKSDDANDALPPVSSIGITRPRRLVKKNEKFEESDKIALKKRLSRIRNNVPIKRARIAKLAEKNPPLKYRTRQKNVLPVEANKRESLKIPTLAPEKIIKTCTAISSDSESDDLKVDVINIAGDKKNIETIYNLSSVTASSRKGEDAAMKLTVTNRKGRRRIDKSDEYDIPLAKVKKPSCPTRKNIEKKKKKTVKSKQCIKYKDSSDSIDEDLYVEKETKPCLINLERFNVKKYKEDRANTRDNVSRLDVKENGNISLKEVKCNAININTSNAIKNCTVKLTRLYGGKICEDDKTNTCNDASSLDVKKNNVDLEEVKYNTINVDTSSVVKHCSIKLTRVDSPEIQLAPVVETQCTSDRLNVLATREEEHKYPNCDLPSFSKNCSTPIGKPKKLIIALTPMSPIAREYSRHLNSFNSPWHIKPLPPKLSDQSTEKSKDKLKHKSVSNLKPQPIFSLSSDSNKSCSLFGDTGENTNWKPSKLKEASLDGAEKDRLWRHYSETGKDLQNSVKDGTNEDHDISPENSEGGNSEEWSTISKYDKSETTMEENNSSGNTKVESSVSTDVSHIPSRGEDSQVPGGKHSPVKVLQRSNFSCTEVDSNPRTDKIAPSKDSHTPEGNNVKMKRNLSIDESHCSFHTNKDATTGETNSSNQTDIEFSLTNESSYIPSSSSENSRTSEEEDLSRKTLCKSNVSRNKVDEEYSTDVLYNQSHLTNDSQSTPTSSDPNWASKRLAEEYEPEGGMELVTEEEESSNFRLVENSCSSTPDNDMEIDPGLPLDNDPSVDILQDDENTQTSPNFIDPPIISTLLKNPIGVTGRRDKHRNWGVSLTPISEIRNEPVSHSIALETPKRAPSPRNVVNDKLHDSSKNSFAENLDVSTKRETIFLKPGKFWMRSLSIINNIDNKSDLDILSIGKGKKWRHSVQSILNMQAEGLIQSCVKKKVDTKESYGCYQGLYCPDHLPSSELSTVSSASPNRLVKRASYRVVPDKKHFPYPEDSFFLEAYGITASKNRHTLSKRHTLIPSTTNTLVYNVQCEDACIETSDTESIVTARDGVLQKCCQDDYIPFEECFPESYLKHCRKIGEGVYGEVFLHENGENKSVIKIIPIEGNELVNGEPQKRFKEIFSEIVIAKELHNLRFNDKYKTSGFIEVSNIRCIVGKYPDKLVELWKIYDDNKTSDNDCPSMFGENQLYIVLELGHGGQDLEAFVFQTAVQSRALFIQAALALAVAEEALEFEHRDLHWGNVLISQTNESQIKYILNDVEVSYPSNGVRVSIIDFTLSRMLYEGCCIFNDLAMDPELFNARGEYQFEIYRLMRDRLENDWQRFQPYTNILWLHYTLDKMITAVRYRKKTTKAHKNAICQLQELKDVILNYESAYDFVTNCEKVTSLQCNSSTTSAVAAVQVEMDPENPVGNKLRPVI